MAKKKRSRSGTTALQEKQIRRQERAVRRDRRRQGGQEERQKEEEREQEEGSKQVEGGIELDTNGKLGEGEKKDVEETNSQGLQTVSQKKQKEKESGVKEPECGEQNKEQDAGKEQEKDKDMELTDPECEDLVKRTVEETDQAEKELEALSEFFANIQEDCCQEILKMQALEDIQKGIDSAKKRIVKLSFSNVNNKTNTTSSKLEKVTNEKLARNSLFNKANFDDMKDTPLPTIGGLPTSNIEQTNYGSESKDEADDIMVDLLELESFEMRTLGQELAEALAGLETRIMKLEDDRREDDSLEARRPIRVGGLQDDGASDFEEFEEKEMGWREKERAGKEEQAAGRWREEWEDDLPMWREEWDDDLPGQDLVEVLTEDVRTRIYS